MFEHHFPEARFSVWPVGISDDSRAGLLRMFPEVRIVEGTLDKNGRPDSPELAEAWQSADLLLHGSAPGFKGRGYMRAWREAFDKPYGIFGLTHDPLSGVNGTYPRGATLAGFRDACIDAHETRFQFRDGVDVLAPPSVVVSTAVQIPRTVGLQ